MKVANADTKQVSGNPVIKADERDKHNMISAPDIIKADAVTFQLGKNKKK